MVGSFYKDPLKPCWELYVYTVSVFPNPVLRNLQTVHVFWKNQDQELEGRKNMDQLGSPMTGLGNTGVDNSKISSVN